MAKAKELLAEAGYPDGFDLEITVPSSYSQHVDTAQIIADELSQAGVRTTIKQVGVEYLAGGSLQERTVPGYGYWF